MIIRFVTVVLIAFGLFNCRSEKIKSTSAYERIISLSPHMTEILYALGQEDRLVAVSDFCLFPPEAAEKQRIGGFLNPNLEKITMLQPDLILGVPSHGDLAKKMESYGWSFVLLPNDRLNDVFMSIDSLGRLLGVTQRAQQLNQSLRDSLHYYSKKAREISPQKYKAMLVLGREPGGVRQIGVIGRNNFMDSLWVLCGGVNVFGDLGQKFSQISRETILTRDAQLIIEFKSNGRWDESRLAANRQEWQGLSTMAAVRDQAIFVIHGEYALIPGPRMYLLCRDYYEILRRLHNSQG